MRTGKTDQVGCKCHFVMHDCLICYEDKLNCLEWFSEHRNTMIKLRWIQSYLCYRNHFKNYI